MTDQLIHPGAALLANYAAIEVRALRYTYTDFDSRGVPTEVELCDDSEAAFWTVYGFIRGEGLDRICDCPSREKADAMASFLEPLVQVMMGLEGESR